ncbi:MAG TPA: signal peptidase I [Verrucomicrobiae bacterium]|nr:signal peptidase I [Verrucomicrobiae bacterium]
MGKLTKVAKIGLCSLAALFGLVLLGLSLPLRGGQALSIQTGSMEPRLSPGDAVFVKRVPVSALQVGDIVTYISPAHPEQTTTHRIVDIAGPVGRPTYLTLKGDANRTADAPVSPYAVVGKQVASVPYLGRVLDFLRSWAGITLFVYMPALAVVLVEVRKLVAYYRSMEPYVLPEILARRKKKSTHLVRNALAVMMMVVIGSVTVALPVTAALKATATMTGNTIATATLPPPPSAVGGLALRRVFVACTSEDRTKADHLNIILYNAGKTDLNITGWYLQSGATKFYTFAATTVSHRSTFDFATPVPPGVSYDSGSVKLYNAAGQLVDTSSWSHNPTGRPCRIL